MIDFDDSAYCFTHGHAPRGYGSWAFSIHRDQRDPMWVPSMTYSDAKVWIRAKMREQYGKKTRGTLYVCT